MGDTTDGRGDTTDGRDDGNGSSPYRMSAAEFERRHEVPADERRESTEPPAGSTLGGDEAAVLHWNSGSGLRAGDALSDADGD
jgi:hypothetical protein